MPDKCLIRRKQLEAVAQIPVGTVFAFAGATVPTGWLDCDGSAVSRTTYADLFAALGTTYGVGDGSTTFNLPDFRSRSILGAGAPGGGLTTRARGDTGGAETHTLVTGEMPAHTHAPGGGDAEFVTNVGAPGPDGNGFGAALRSAQTATASAGGGGAHNNVSPFGVGTFMVFANA